VTVTVREARPEEYEAIGELTVAAYAIFPEAADDPGYLAELRDVARRAAACPIYAALDDTGKVLGSATYVPGPGNPLAESERPGEAGIRMLAVAPWAQGQGVGTALARALVERARAEGRRGVALLSLPAMQAAHRLYERLGFRRAPGRDWEPAPGLRLLGFELELDEGGLSQAAPRSGSAGG
jgi:ribosomal protein S18 acetylase RimI-like enzyme